MVTGSVIQKARCISGWVNLWSFFPLLKQSKNSPVAGVFKIKDFKFSISTAAELYFFNLIFIPRKVPVPIPKA